MYLRFLRGPIGFVHMVLNVLIDISSLLLIFWVLYRFFSDSHFFQEFLNKQKALEPDKPEDPLPGPGTEKLETMETVCGDAVDQKVDILQQPMECKGDEGVTGGDVNSDPCVGDGSMEPGEESSEMTERKKDEDLDDMKQSLGSPGTGESSKVISVDTKDILDNDSVPGTVETLNNLDDKKAVKIPEHDVDNNQESHSHGNNIFDICSDFRTQEPVVDTGVTEKLDVTDNISPQDEKDPSDETTALLDVDQPETEQDVVPDDPPVVDPVVTNKETVKKPKYSYKRKRKYKYKKQTFKSPKRAKTEGYENRPRRCKSLREILACGDSSPTSEFDVRDSGIADIINQRDSESLGQSLQESLSQSNSLN